MPMQTRSSSNQTPCKGGKGNGNSKQFVVREEPIIQVITKRALRALVKRASSGRQDIRVSRTVYEVSGQMIEEFMERVLTHAILYANSAGRTNLCKSDIEHGLRAEVCPSVQFVFYWRAFLLCSLFVVVLGPTRRHMVCCIESYVPASQGVPTMYAV